MRKLVLALAATAALSSAAFAQNVSNTQLIITGEITDASCSMKIDPINFQSISVKAFEGSVDAKSGWELTNIEFYKCVLDDSQNNGPKVDKIDVVVSPGPAAGTTAFYANSGSAENIGIELEVNRTAVNANQGLVINDLDLNSVSKSVPVRARLAKVGPVAAGDINAAIGITAEYK